MIRKVLVAALAAGALSLLYLLPATPPLPWSAGPASADHCAVRPTVGASVLRTGSSGDQVWVLQVALVNAGYPALDPDGLPYIDGLFGSPEDTAVRAFQTSRGLPTTGVVDTATWTALRPYIDPSDRYAAAQPTYGQLSAAFNSGGFNGLFPGHTYYGLQAIEVGPRGARQLTTPYIPPTLLKAVGWIEASWRQGDSGGAPVISRDCGYGVMQLTYPGIPLAGISWGMKEPAPEPIYSQVQVPIATSYAHNIAFGAKTLIAKWNAAPEWRPVVGNGDPALLEDWYYAVWSYNGFSSKNDPNRYDPLRGEYSCNVSDGFSHNRTQFPYQELVLGCVKHPPAVNGVALWPPIPVALPVSVPPFNWENPQTMDIPTPQPAHSDPTSGSLPVPVTIDTPSAGEAAQPFAITGWAVDYATQSGTGIDAVHVYAYPSDAAGTPTGAPQFLGAAGLGAWRADVATTFGNPGFATSGYGLTVRGLRPGFYRIVVYARSTVTGGWSDAHRVVLVPRGDAMSLDIPSAGPVGQPFLLAGWAIDQAAASGTGVDAVHLYAYPADPSGAMTGAPPIFLGAAAYGGSRPDVGAAFGGQFTSSAYVRDITGLSAGYYQLVAYARSTVSGHWQNSARLIHVP